MASKQPKLLRTLTANKVDAILSLLCCLFFLYAMYAWMKKRNIFPISPGLDGFRPLRDEVRPGKPSSRMGYSEPPLSL
jgi:hypothetical protein